MEFIEIVALRSSQLVGVSQTIDLANEHVHTILPDVADNQLAQAIAKILQNTTSASQRVREIHRLLKPLGISKQSVLLAYGASGKSAVLPNNKPGKHGLNRSTSVMQAARAREAYYRALYVVSSARRVQESRNDGKPVRVTLADESLNYRRHQEARRGRLDAVAKAAHHADMFGDLLGWYLDPSLNNEAECIAANGHNFIASEGTIIGYPGAVHPNCGCASGPPWPGGAENMCNDFLADVTRRGRQQRYTVRNKPQRRKAS